MPLRLPASARGLPQETWVLAVVAFCVALGFGIVAPAIPLFALELGVGSAAAGAVVSAFALMRFVSGLAAGRLVDRVGERTALVAGIAVVAVSSLLAGLALSYPQLLVLRGVGGVGSAVFTIASTSLLLRVAAADQRGRTQGVQRAGFLLGGMVGPALGGAVVGFSLRAPFFLYAATLVLAGVAGAVLLPRAERARAPARGAPGGDAVTATSGEVLVRDPPEPVTAAPRAEPVPAPRDEPVAERTALREALAVPAYRAALAGNFAIGFSLFGVRSSLVPLLVVQGLGLAPGWVGAAFLVSTVVQAVLLLPAGQFVDTRGRRPALVVGGLGTAAGLGALALVDGPVGLLVAMAVFGAGGSLLGVAPAAVVGDVVQGRGGTAVAVWQMASDLGAIVGPLAAGFLVDEASFAVALLLSAVVVAVCGLLGLAVPARARA